MGFPSVTNVQSPHRVNEITTEPQVRAEGGNKRKTKRRKGKGNRVTMTHCHKDQNFLVSSDNICAAVRAQIDHTPVAAYIDTGAQISLMSAACWKRTGGKQLHSWAGGEILSLTGEVEVRGAMRVTLGIGETGWARKVEVVVVEGLRC